MDVIEAVGLGKRYGRKKWGLRDCTLSLPAGCVTGLVGPNGSGTTPVVVTGTEPAGIGNWVVGKWFTTTSGAPVNQATVPATFARLPFGATPSTAMLAQHHWLRWWSYQPASRWWQFQLTEGGWLLAASLLLIAGAVLLIRRRPA
jgi:ABC-type branched-subunit amino acid transport system ATPase component